MSRFTPQNLSETAIAEKIKKSDVYVCKRLLIRIKSPGGGRPTLSYALDPNTLRPKPAQPLTDEEAELERRHYTKNEVMTMNKTVLLNFNIYAYSNAWET